MENLETGITEFEKTSTLMLQFIRSANQTFERIENSIQNLDIKLEHFKTEFNSKIDYVAEGLNAKIDYVATELNAKIDHVATELNAKIDHVATELNAKIDHVAIELNAKIVALDTRLETLEINFDNFKTETSLELKVITRKLDAIQIEITKINNVTRYEEIFDNEQCLKPTENK